MPPSKGAAEKQKMNGFQPFVFEGIEIKFIPQDNSFSCVLADVCRILGIGNASDVARRIPESEKGVDTIDTLGGKQRVVTISEPGLYRVIFESRKPEAERMKSWVFSEVLPAIRKTGTYSAPKSDTHLMKVANQFEGAIKIANLLGFKGNQGLLSASRVIEESFGVNPVTLFKAELDAPNQNRLMTPTEIGKELERISGRKHSARMVNQALLALGLQTQTAAGWEATEAAKSEGLAVLQDVGKKHSNGTPIQQLKWSREVVEQLKGGCR